MFRKRYIIKTVRKNRILCVCPIFSNGGSTGFAPIQVRILSVAIRIAIIVFFIGLYFIDRVFSFFMVGIANTVIDMARAITPPNFDGIERRIAYANRKYHSGWMWVGVVSGLASV